ncbi:hypothetical protein LZC95_33625 [Pendulispora brunnea]|uniref:EamA domain-containing protein n=1 Tax=Pendulispora brunnea TaxID=2905690 RepID=A0ABZ2JZZ5_9BACT
MALHMLAPHRLGLLLVAAAAVLWSTAGYFTRAVPLDIAALLFWRGLFGAMTSFVFILAKERRDTLRAFAAMGRIGLLFCLLSSCGMACFVASLTLSGEPALCLRLAGERTGRGDAHCFRRLQAAQTALIGALETALAPLWVWLAFGETPQGATMLGGVLVLCAVIGSVVWERRGREACLEVT